MTAARKSIIAALVGGIAALLLAGCPSPPEDDRDGGDDEIGLILKFQAKDEIPVEIGDQTTLLRLDMALRNLRAIGDAAPGDERTTRDMYAMFLAAEAESEPVAFMSAPPGVYSRVETSIDGSAAGTPSYALSGTVTIGVDEVPFEITDDVVLPLVVPLSQIELSPGHVVTIELTVDLKKWVEGVDIELFVPDPDGTIRIDQNDPEILLVRDAIDKSFAAGAK